MLINLYKQLKQLFLKDKVFFSESFFFSFFAGISAILNYIFQFYAARNLSKSDFGLLNTLLAAVAILGIIINLGSNWSQKAFAKLNNNKQANRLKGAFLKTILLSAGFAIFFSISLFLLKPHFKNYFKISNEIYFIMLISILAVQILQVPFKTLLFAFKKYRFLALSNLSFPLARVVLLFLFILTQLSLSKALFSHLASQIFFMLLLLIFSLFTFKQITKKFEQKKIRDVQFRTLFTRKLISSSLLGIAVMVLITNLDMLLIRRFFPQSISGDYALVTIFGRTIFFAGGLFIPVFSSNITVSHANGKKTITYLLKGMLYLSVILLLAIGIILTFGPFLIQKMLPDYSHLYNLIYMYSLFSVCNTYNNLLSIFHVATNQTWIFLIQIPLVLLMIPIYYFGEWTLMHIIFINIVISFSVLMTFITSTIITYNKQNYEKL